MSINRQIGWSQESNLLYDILKKLQRLTSVVANISGGGTSSLRSVIFTPLAGVSTFFVPEIVGKRVIGVSRSGLIKCHINTTATTSDYLQIEGAVSGDDIIANGTVNLPTGDITQTSELFIFTIEL